MNIFIFRIKSFIPVESWRIDQTDGVLNINSTEFPPKILQIDTSARRSTQINWRLFYTRTLKCRKLFPAFGSIVPRVFFTGWFAAGFMSTPMKLLQDLNRSSCPAPTFTLMHFLLDNVDTIRYDITDCIMTIISKLPLYFKNSLLYTPGNV